MQCEVCKDNEATIHLTEIVEGVRAEMHLCEGCAAEQGITVNSNVPINELLSNLLSAQPSDEELFGPGDEKLSCPHCGFTLEQFRHKAVLGCAQDYEVFEKALLPLISKAQNGQTIHSGKIPAKAPEAAKNQIKLLNLRQELDVAVRKENYELAAELRDKIKADEDK